MLSRQSSYRPGSVYFLIKTLILAAWLAALGLLVINRQNILDWWQMRNYQAPAAVAQIAREDNMNAYGRKIFYVNHPAIISKNSFVNHCPNGGGEQTIVLGCYHSGQRGIYVLRVTDSRLDGVEQVTSAHEMLHAAYDRLDKSDRSKIDTMLLDYYHNHLTDQRIKTTIEAYKQSEPNALVDEMHSIFGTEVLNLPAPLEKYYQRYFTNRQQVAKLAADYQGEFTSRQNLISSYDNQLANIKTRIEAMAADLKKLETKIRQQDRQLSGLKQTDPAAYNAAVPAYNALIGEYKAKIATTNSLINQYNVILRSRNALAIEQNQLINELSGEVNQFNN